LKSDISATSKTISSKCSIHSQVLAETGHIIVVHPQSSEIRPCSDKADLTFSTFAHSLSILFIATIIGIPASFA